MTKEKFSVLKTEFLRISKCKVIQVEIHPSFLQKASTNKCWFEDEHLQEIIQLMRPVILVRCSSGLKISENKDYGDVLSGPTVRIGYVFKRKEDNHTCLLPVKCITCINEDINEEVRDTGRYRCFYVHKEKLLVYVCPLTDSTQSSMTQLLTVVGGKKQATFGISGYFQKSPQNKQTTMASAPVATEPTTSHQDEPQKKIKNIIKRSGPILSRKRRTNKISKNVPVLSESKSCHYKVILEKPSEKQIIDEDITTKHQTKIADENDDDFRVYSESSSEDTDCIQQNEVMAIEVCVEVDIMSQNSEKENVIQKTEKHTKPLTLSQTELSAKLLSEFSNSYNIDDEVEDDEILMAQQNKKLKVFDHKIEKKNFDDKDEESYLIEKKINRLKSIIKNHQDELSDDDFCENMKTIAKTISSPKCKHDIPKIAVTKNTDMAKHPLDKSVEDESESVSPDSSTPLMLKTKTKLKCPRVSNIGISLSSTSLLTEQNNVVSTYNKQITPCKSISGNTSDSEDNTPESTILDKKKLPTRRTKRIQLPATDIMPETKKRKHHVSKISNKPKIKSQKITNNYSIFSETSDQAERSILDFFSKCKSPVINAIKPSVIMESVAMDISEDLDLCLIEELSVMPNVKDERNIERKRDIFKLDNVSELTEEQIRLLVLDSENYLRDIFQGKIACRRHQDYRKGGKDKNNLNYQVHLELFTEEQHDVVMETLIEMFCKNHHKYLDYLMKVLLPEILIRIYMEVKGTSHKETEEIMRNPQL